MGLQNSINNVQENAANKDASGGYAGLTLLKINFKNALGTFVSFFTNSNTAVRTYTFQDRDGTIADNTDIASVGNTPVDFSASGNVTGFSAITTNIYDYVRIGRLVYVWVEVIGTSDSTTTGFDLPFAPLRSELIVPFRVRNNGSDSNVLGRALWTAGSVTVAVGQTAGNGTWTASGDKRYTGFFWYITQS